MEKVFAKWLQKCNNINIIYYKIITNLKMCKHERG